MARLTMRQALINLVELYPDMTSKEAIKTLVDMKYVFTPAEAARIFDELSFFNASPVGRHRDIHADSNLYEIDMEKKGSIRFGIISDTHFGSKHHRREELEKCVDLMVNEGIKNILCPGDLLEGNNVYPGQLHDLSAVTEDDQLQEAIMGLPLLPKGSRYFWISGNHDLIWLKRNTGSDPLVAFDLARRDVVYLGKHSCYIKAAPKVNIQMVHPMKGSTMTVSYAAQKFIDGLVPENRPNISLFGHWHNTGYFSYKGVRMELCPSFQGANELSVRNGWSNIVGGKIVEIDLNKEGGIQRYNSSEYTFGEKGIKDLRVIKL